MEVYERIRLLRKKYLNLSQSEFGKRLGVSRSVIKNIETNVLARPDQKLSLFKLICCEFNVNEDWLFNGNEPVFTHTKDSGIDIFMIEHGISDEEKSMLDEYVKLDADARHSIMKDINRLILSASRAEHK